MEEGGSGSKGSKTSRLEAKALNQFFEFALIYTNISFMASLAVMMTCRDLQGHVNRLLLAFCAFLPLANLICGMTLLFLTIYLRIRQKYSSRTSSTVERGQRRVLMFLFVIAYALFIITASTFLILLHECYNSLATLIPAASFILCMLFYFLIQVVNYNEDQPTSSYYEPIKSELKQSFGLSSTVVSLAFGGLTTTILNVSKHSSAAGNEAHVISNNTEICILVLFFTFMLGFLLMWLSSAPPRVLKRLGTRDLAVKCLKALSYCLLGFLALIAAVAASEFLEGYVVLVLLLVPFLGVMVWFAMEYYSEQKPSNTNDDKMELKLMGKVATASTSISFGAMMSVYSVFLGSKAMNIKICMLVTFFAFIAGFSAKLLTFCVPKSISESD